jgi:hypothetical protein
MTYVYNFVNIKFPSTYVDSICITTYIFSKPLLFSKIFFFPTFDVFLFNNSYMSNRSFSIIYPSFYKHIFLDFTLGHPIEYIRIKAKLVSIHTI